MRWALTDALGVASWGMPIVARGELPERPRLHRCRGASPARLSPTPRPREDNGRAVAVSGRLTPRPSRRTISQSSRALAAYSCSRQSRTCPDHGPAWRRRVLSTGKTSDGSSIGRPVRGCSPRAPADTTKPRNPSPEGILCAERPWSTRALAGSSPGGRGLKSYPGHHQKTLMRGSGPSCATC